MTVLVSNNILYFGGEITPETSINFISSFHELERTNTRSNVLQVVCTGSCGGYWENGGLPIVETILSSEFSIETYALGMVASTSALIFLAGDFRYMGKDSLLLLHDGSKEVEGSIREIEDHAPLLKLQREKDYKYISDCSNRPPSYWEERLKKDTYIWSEEALQLDLIDQIKTLRV